MVSLRQVSENYSLFVRDAFPCKAEISGGLASSNSKLLYVHRDHKVCQGQGTQHVHLDFHTAPELCSSKLLYVHRDHKVYYGRGTQHVHLDFHTAPELCSSKLLYVHRDHKVYYGRGTQHVHLDFHTAPELWVNECHISLSFSR